MTELISIIVPVYNVLPYLDPCLLSVCNQSYKNLEIILIDDGSNDGCSEVCDAYALQDTRIKVIHTANGGLSSARNVGIEHATGKYLVFIDSDDIVHPMMIEKLYQALVTNHADISICMHQTIGQDETPKFTFQTTSDTEMLTGHACILRMYSGQSVDMVVAWNKMYKREYFRSIRYPVGRKHEDEFTTYKILYSLEKCIYVKEALYFYRIRNNSITQKKDFSKILDKAAAFHERMLFFENNKEKELYLLALKKYENILADAVIECTKPHCSNAEQIKILKKTFRKTFFEKILFSSIHIVYKVKYIVFMLNKPIYTAIMHKIQGIHDEKDTTIQ